MKHIFQNVFFILTLSSSVATAEDGGVENLSVETRELLQKEMLSIEAAMKDIISANAAGDLEKIALIAKQIKESFILKQHLSKQQKHELHTKLPDDFLSKDKEFHYMAGMLAHVAENNKSELVNFYFSKLFEACSSCHKVHAKHKFTKFSNNVKVDDHKH